MKYVVTADKFDGAMLFEQVVSNQDDANELSQELKDMSWQNIEIVPLNDTPSQDAFDEETLCRLHDNLETLGQAGIEDIEEYDIRVDKETDERYN